MSTIEPELVSELPNFRDPAEHPGLSRAIKRSVLFRSAAPESSGPEALAALQARGLSTVIDFRADVEKAGPHPFAEGFQVMDHPIDGANGSFETILSGGLAALYGTLLRTHGDTFARAASDVAHAEGGVLIHCTAGKDRTGLMMAMLLLLAGAERESVVEDYARSEPELAGPWAERMLSRVSGMVPVMSPAIVEVVSGSPAAAMHSALTTLDAEYGGAAAYLLANGLSSDDLDLLRSRLASA
ncbi:tyrosine-protein phosphatase [Arthrobacter sp. NPDC090010]|uniref:tyrosine-protein phosphatase n=1 Tax=Arthrobacter sp. NPDC090010 TaxID=3363942 RepID=UPI00381D6514